MAVETNLRELTAVIIACFVSNNPLAAIERLAQISAHTCEVAIPAPGRRPRKIGYLMYRHIVEQHPNRILSSLNFSQSERRRTTCRFRLRALPGLQAEMTAGL